MESQRPIPQTNTAPNPRGRRSSIDGFIAPRRIMVPNRPRPTMDTVRPSPTPIVESKVRKTSIESLEKKTVAADPIHAPASQPLKKPKRKKNRLKFVATAVAIVSVVGLSVYASIDSLIASHQVKAGTVKAENQPQPAASGPAVDESKPPEDSISGYRVAADLPRIIKIDSIGVAARVLRMSILPDNELNTPKSSYDAGWYEGSAKPGEAGAMILNGHYAGPTKPGIFYKLDQTKPGALITIEKGDGVILKYKVTSVQTMGAKEVPMTDLLISKNPGHQDLNIITCTGTFDHKTQTYDKRVVLRATGF